MKRWLLLFPILFSSIPVYADNISESEVSCMTDAIVHEAGAEIYAGQVAVANVIKNRSIVSGKTPCNVVHEKHNGRYEFSYLAHRKAMRDRNQIETARNIALDVLNDNEKDVTSGSQFFRQCYHSGRHNGNLKFVKKIGNQCYYKDMNPNDVYADSLLESTSKDTGVPGYREINYSDNYTQIAKVWDIKEEKIRKEKMLNKKDIDNTVAINNNSSLYHDVSLVWSQRDIPSADVTPVIEHTVIEYKPIIKRKLHIQKPDLHKLFPHLHIPD